ncbi:MAG TPA: hypothetical protein VK202_02210, partial [Bacteroidia bacterium]|nr:hypothetical protein [Bacteroidia bacterium]
MDFNFPALPNSKTEIVEFDLTLEQRAILKLIEKEDLTKKEIAGIQEAIEFYKITFPYLQSIPLSTINDDDALQIKKYLNEAINFQIIVENDITFEILSRVTPVKEKFLENGKVRDPKYIIHPSIEVLKELGLYNRASSPELSLFYASFHETVALHEVKPKVGERIIITKWRNTTGKKFVSFPISNNETVKNRMLQHSTAAIKKLGEKTNPLLFALIHHHLLFLSTEFVKNENIVHPKRYEYLFSAYFGDELLNDNKIISDKIKPKNDKGKNMGNFDCILYPSVAFNHKEENVAVSPRALFQNLKPVKIEESIV